MIEIQNPKTLKYFSFKYSNLFRISRSGQAALPTIVLLGGLMVEVVIAGALIVFLFNNSTYGTRLSVEALGAAHSGVQDALLRLSINKNFENLTGYNLLINSRSSVNVVIDRDPISLGEGKTSIISTGTTLTRSRKLQAIVNINSVTGSMKVESLSEISL